MSSRPSSVPRLPRRGVLAGPLVAGATVLATLVVTRAAGIPMRDPDHVAAGYVAMVGAAVLILVGVDLVARAWSLSPSRLPSRAALRAVRRERWTRHRGLAVGAALISFYVTYMAYRNLKAAVPLLRPDTLFDDQLARLDRALLGGHEAAAALHSLLGTGAVTQILSVAYVAFIVFLPLSLALALVFSPGLHASLFYATALSINWVLGAASYFLLPALGPVYADPQAFAALPHSEVTYLQQVLLDQRVAFLDRPGTATLQAVAAFVSLHIAMSFTAAMAAQMLGLRRRLRVALWAWLAVTACSTVYFGWHYVLDDVGGIVTGALALLLAALLTGFDPRAARARPAYSSSGNGYVQHAPPGRAGHRSTPAPLTPGRRAPTGADNVSGSPRPR